MSRILYVDCFSGVAGDMFLGALLDLGASEAAIRAGLAQLGIDAFTLQIGRGVRHGIVGTDVTVRVSGPDTHLAELPKSPGGGSHHHPPAPLDHHHHPDSKHSALHHHHHHGETQSSEVAHRHGLSWPTIRSKIAAAGLSARATEIAQDAFRRLAVAEGQLHGVAPDEVHFHEVGATDAIVDICGTAIALDALGIDAVVSAPVPTPRGTVQCAHGVLPLPAPATLELLRGAEIYGVDEAGEWVTPTGAALLMSVSERFGPIPSGAVVRVGYGVGDRDPTTRANLLRLILIERAAATPSGEIVIEANIDDMTGELFGWATQQLLALGALDVWLTPIQMKKGRPGTQLSVLCSADKRALMVDTVLRETTSLGIRFHTVERVTVERSRELLATPLGPVHLKIGHDGSGVTHVAPEYEDCRALATHHELPLKRVLATVWKAANAAGIGIGIDPDWSPDGSAEALSRDLDQRHGPPPKSGLDAKKVGR